MQSKAVMYTNLSYAHPQIQTDIFLTCIEFLIMLYAGFNGWRLVQTHHIGIDPVTVEDIDAQIGVEKNASEIFTDKERESSNVRRENFEELTFEDSQLTEPIPHFFTTK
jgi:hypothetical protein